MTARGIRVAIRADASSAIGTGHIFRSMALFEQWQSQGGTCFFVCRETPGHMIGFLRERGFRVRAIADTDDPITDAIEFKTAVEIEDGADAVWVDHYGLDAKWETNACTDSQVLCVVDDLANRPHACDILFDSSHQIEESGLYDELLPKGATRLIGQEYIPLRREFVQYPSPQRDPRMPVERLLITLGGNDPLDASSLVLNALDHPSLSFLKVDLTVGNSNPKAAKLVEQARKMPGVTVRIQHERMAELMAQADLCIGAGGTTSWERCYMALPTLGFILAQNQTVFMQRLESLGVAINLGWADRLSAEDLRMAILKAIDDADWRERSGLAGKALVDGRGVNRVLGALKAKVAQKL